MLWYLYLVQVRGTSYIDVRRFGRGHEMYKYGEDKTRRYEVRVLSLRELFLLRSLGLEPPLLILRVVVVGLRAPIRLRHVWELIH